VDTKVTYEEGEYAVAHPKEAMNATIESFMV